VLASTGGVAAGPIEAVDEAKLNWIATGGDDDWDG
jgi:hypothetical protein